MAFVNHLYIKEQETANSYCSTGRNHKLRPSSSHKLMGSTSRSCDQQQGAEYSRKIPVKIQKDKETMYTELIQQKVAQQQTQDEVKLLRVENKKLKVVD